MVRRLTLVSICILSLSSTDLFAQTEPTWRALVNAPVASRIDDASFINESVGWVVNTRGQIWRTSDAGESWVHLLDQPITAFRCVAFMDSTMGWAGNLGTEEYAGATDTTVLYQTKNSGIKWTPVTTIGGPMPRGLCGMQVVNDSVIVASGRVRGPAFFVKSIDGGNSWISQNMSLYAAGLVDCYFFTPDSGFVVGLTNSNHADSHGIILFTADGGDTWETRFVTTQDVEWCWKVSFPSPKVGYVSLQKNYGGPVNILKTTDGGQTWEEKRFLNQPYYVQGIGFATDSLGWIGGNSSNPVYETRDGGETWYPVDYLGSRINRFQMLSETVGYAVGRTVYKYSVEQPTVVDKESIAPKEFVLYQNYPNPISRMGESVHAIGAGRLNITTTIRYEIPRTTFVSIRIYDLLGKEVARLVSEENISGIHKVEFDARDLASGLYFYRFVAGDVVETKKMLVVD